MPIDLAEQRIQFSELFDGRTDVWGKIHGECVKDEPLTDEHWKQHLYGRGSLGIYPSVLADGQQWVKWGCTDIDQGIDMIVLAKNLWRALGALQITSWVERSKGKGYHVWVFCSTWVPADDMRAALLVAHQVAGVPPTEVNPKQVDIGSKKPYGNYVNLPYARRWSDEGKRVVLDMRLPQPVPLRLDEFLERAYAALNTPEKIAKAAALYVPPPPAKPVEIELCTDEELKVLTDKLDGLAWTVFQEGPLEGSDRSNALARLAHMCADCELTPGETLRLMLDADARWGKFSDREDCEEQLQRLVTNAYRRR